MAETIDKKLLQRGWLHSHEEDGPSTAVFRPDTVTLPPARGRTGYVFEADGRAIQRGPGPSDRSVSSVGTWRLDPDGRLILSFPGAPERTLTVKSLEPDRLVIEKT